MSYSNRDDDSQGASVYFSIGGFAIVAILALAIFGWPIYNVWSKGLGGEAMLREAESTRRVAVLDATAKKDAAVMLAQAEIERAKGVAEANKIIGASLENNPRYLQYLYITELAEGAEKGNKTIYVPTEGGMPVPTLNIRGHD
ncbi:MAG: membrane protease subunit [Cyanobium sp.]|nr:membrane protease subunit [Cyanobium sp.]